MFYSMVAKLAPRYICSFKLFNPHQTFAALERSNMSRELPLLSDQTIGVNHVYDAAPRKSWISFRLALKSP